MKRAYTTYRDAGKPNRAASVKTECSVSTAFTKGPAYQAGPNPKRKDDLRLTREHLAGAFENGYGRTVHTLQGYGLTAADAEEIAQQAWVKAYMRAVQLRNPRNILPWVRTIAINLLRDEKRREARFVPLRVDYPAPAQQTRFFDLDRLIAHSSPEQREVLQVWTQGYSTAEIAKRSGLSRGAVLARISRAVRSARRLAKGGVSR